MHSVFMAKSRLLFVLGEVLLVLERCVEEYGGEVE